MRERPVTIMDTLLEQLIETGPDGMARVFTALFELAMRTERDQHIGAGRYERTDGRQGYAKGYKPKTVDTPAGTLTVQVPKTREQEEPRHPGSDGRTGALAAVRPRPAKQPDTEVVERHALAPAPGTAQTHTASGASGCGPGAARRARFS